MGAGARLAAGASDEATLTLVRLRVATWIGAVSPAVAVTVYWLVLGDELDGERIAALVFVGGISALGLIGSHAPWVRGHVDSFTVATVTTVGVSSLWALSLAGSDIDIFVGVVVAMMIASSLVMTRGPGPQAFVSLVLAVGYAGITPWDHYDPERVMNIGLTLAVGVGLSVSAAVTLDRQRRSRAELIAALEAASRSKSDFLSTVSHEIRTPMNVLIGYVEMLRDPETPEPERDELLARVATAAQQIAELVEGTLAIGRLEDDGRDLRLEAVPLDELWRSAERACELLPRRAGVELAWLRDVPPAVALTDPRRFPIVVRNLVSNALKFTERGGVTASLAVAGGAIEVRVADTGIGIAPADQARIFEKFQQAADRGRAAAGIGLGLYIAHQFATQLGGSIAIDSAPGRGSTFTVRLPMRPALGADARERGGRPRADGNAAGAYGIGVAASSG